MMTYYLVSTEGDVRFVPSLVLSHVLPCKVYGVLSVDEEHCFSVSELYSFNTVVSEIFKEDEAFNSDQR